MALIRKKGLVLLLLYLVFNIRPVHPRDTVNNSLAAITTFNMFREPSYILLGRGIGNMEPLIFEGDIVPYYMLRINRNVKWGVELSPRIILRMYNQSSHPVRTPSFMPGITFFYQLIDNENEKRDLFTYCSWLHHSNGQEGKFYKADSTSINTLSGSFFANWIEGGVFLSRPDPSIPYTTNYLRLFIAYNYMQAKELNGIYGRLRFFSDFQSTVDLSKVFEIFNRSNQNRNFTLNQSLHLGWIAGNISGAKAIDKKRFICRYTLTFKPSFLNDVTLFIQYYYGQDYYNIYFNRTLSVLRFGFSSKAKIFN